MRLTAKKIPTRHTLALRILPDPVPVLYPVLPEGHQEPESAPIRAVSIQTTADEPQARKSPENALRARAAVNYEQEAADLLDYFIEYLPAGPIRLHPHILIADPELFVASHIETLLRHPRNPFFMPYLERLRSLKSLAARCYSDVSVPNPDTGGF